jgi:hypothetical protein
VTPPKKPPPRERGTELGRLGLLPPYDRPVRDDLLNRSGFDARYDDRVFAIEPARAAVVVYGCEYIGT